MRGKLLINGNLGSPKAFVERIAPHLDASARSRRPQVLLINAAWRGGEFGDDGLRAAFAPFGLGAAPPDEPGGIRNLGVYHAWQRFLADHPSIAAESAALAEVEDATRRYYIEKTTFLARRLRETVAACGRHAPGFRLGSLPESERDPTRSESSLSPRDLFVRALCRELVADLDDLRRNDARMLQALAEAESALPERTGLRLLPRWIDERRELEQRILRADAIVVPGGDPPSLLSALRFYDLRPALAETLRRGATFFTISAGSLLLGERVVLYDDFNPDPSRREFQLFDRGLGLVGGLQILPHCMDRIHTDDGDNLAYLSRRFSTHLCVGLNAESFLLVEPGTGTARSAGPHDGVYVFGADGVKWRYSVGETVPLF